MRLSVLNQEGLGPSGVAGQPSRNLDAMVQPLFKNCTPEDSKQLCQVHKEANSRL
jgi:hypothetical protein